MDGIQSLMTRLCGRAPKQETFEDMMNTDIRPKPPPVKKDKKEQSNPNQPKKPDQPKISKDRSKLIVRKNASKK